MNFNLRCTTTLRCSHISSFIPIDSTATKIHQSFDANIFICQLIAIRNTHGNCFCCSFRDFNCNYSRHVLQAIWLFLQKLRHGFVFKSWNLITIILVVILLVYKLSSLSISEYRIPKTYTYVVCLKRMFFL